MRNQSFWVLGGVWSQGWNLKELTEGHHQEWSLRLNLTQHGETHQVQTQWGLTDWELFLDFVGGGAWPFLVGGVICQVNSGNERDWSLLISFSPIRRECPQGWMRLHHFLKGLISIVSRLIGATVSTVPFQSEKKIMEAFSNNRSVMPLDILGCTRATMEILASICRRCPFLWLCHRGGMFYGVPRLK